MSDIALQIERGSAGSVAQTGNVIFESTVFYAGNVGYDPGTGVITLNDPGRYVIHWWVATQSSISTNGVVFSLVPSQGDILQGDSPIKTGQVGGVGIIEVTAAPVTVFLRNDSLGDVYYSVTVPVKASLVVISAPAVNAFGALLSDEGSIALTDTPVVVPMDVQSNIFEGIDYSTPNAITITEPGAYRIDILASGIAVVEAGISLALAINGSAIAEMTQGLDFISVNATTFSMTNYLSLNAGDVLTLQMSSTPDITFYLPPVGPGITLSVQRMP